MGNTFSNFILQLITVVAIGQRIFYHCKICNECVTDPRLSLYYDNE